VKGYCYILVFYYINLLWSLYVMILQIVI